MVTEGVEPSTPALLARCSNQLSYATFLSIALFRPHTTHRIFANPHKNLHNFKKNLFYVNSFPMAFLHSDPANNLPDIFAILFSNPLQKDD